MKNIERRLRHLEAVELPPEPITVRWVIVGHDGPIKTLERRGRELVDVTGAE